MSEWTEWINEPKCTERNEPNLMNEWMNGAKLNEWTKWN